MRSRIGRVVALTAIAGVAAAPAAAAVNESVQIGGRLVAPSQVSVVQSELSSPSSSHLVQIGGRLVRPEQVSAAQTGDHGRVQSRESDSSPTWADTAIVFSIAAALLLGMAVRGARRRRPVTAL